MYTERAKSVFVNRRGFKRLLQSPFPVGQADKILRRLLHGEHMRLEVSMETSHPAAAVTKSGFPFIVHPASRKWMLTWLHRKPKRKSKRHHFPLNPGHIQVADPGHIIYFSSLLIPGFSLTRAIHLLCRTPLPQTWLSRLPFMVRGFPS